MIRPYLPKLLQGENKCEDRVEAGLIALAHHCWAVGGEREETVQQARDAITDILHAVVAMGGDAEYETGMALLALQDEVSVRFHEGRKPCLPSLKRILRIPTPLQIARRYHRHARRWNPNHKEESVKE